MIIILITLPLFLGTLRGVAYCLDEVNAFGQIASQESLLNGRPSGNYASTHSIDGGIDGDLRGNQVNISILMGDADVLLGFHFLHARCFCPIELG